MPSVLIIDDHDATLETLSAILQASGFETAVASSGANGVILATARSFDVLLIDLRLPDISGIDVVRRLKRSGVSGRMVIVTAFPELDSSFDAGAAGADGYVDGPLWGEDVVSVVSQALNGPFPVQQLLRGSNPRSGRITSQRASTLDPRVREVMRLIDEEFGRSWSMDELAARVELSPSRLRHLFSECLSVSVTEYLMQRRLQEAARCLLTSSENIRQIAYRVGFKSLSLRDFRRAFRARFGVSPIEYRERQDRGRLLQS